MALRLVLPPRAPADTATHVDARVSSVLERVVFHEVRAAGNFVAFRRDRARALAHSTLLSRVALPDVPASPVARWALHEAREVRGIPETHDGIAIFHFFAKRSAPLSSVSREYECGYRSRELA
jgi:hypothetical protein